MTPLEQVNEWKKEGRTHVSCHEASLVLHCSAAQRASRRLPSERWHIPPAVGMEEKVIKSQTVMWAEQFQAYQKPWNRPWR